MAVLTTPPPAHVARPAAPGAAHVALQKQLPYADLFRALAIAYVFFGHAGGLVRQPAFHRIAASDAIALFDGVAMLFCLSGFLLAGPFLRAFLDTPHELPLIRPYLWARILRIAPLYLTAVVAIALAQRLGGASISLRDVALHLALLQDFSADTIQSLSGPLWTMPLDAQFYLVLPLGFAVAARIWRTHAQRTRIAAVFGCVALVIALSLAYRFAVVAQFAPQGLDRQLFVVDQLPGMAALFALGIAARLVVLLRERRGMRLTGTVVVALVAGAFVCRWLQYGAHLAWLHLAAGSDRFAPAAFAAVDEAIGGCGCALLLIAADALQRTRFGRFAASPVVAIAAALSYALYLFHEPVLRGVHPFIHGSGTAALALLVVAALAVLVPLCVAAHYGIEAVFLRRKAQLTRVRTAGIGS